MYVRLNQLSIKTQQVRPLKNILENSSSFLQNVGKYCVFSWFLNLLCNSVTHQCQLTMEVFPHLFMYHIEMHYTISCIRIAIPIRNQYLGTGIQFTICIYHQCVSNYLLIYICMYSNMNYYNKFPRDMIKTHETTSIKC